MEAPGDARAALVLSGEILKHLDRLELSLTRDYYSAFRRAAWAPRRVSAEEYLHGSTRAWPDRSILCPEMPLPQQFTAAVQLELPSGAAWTKSAVALVHAGRTGCMAPVHFDWDHSWVAHACLTGRKRVFLFPPSAGWLLSPMINTSSLCVPRFSPSDRQELLDRLGGTEVVLQTGEGLLFPSMFWHGVLYDEPSLSLSVRFEPHPGGRPFAVLPRSFWLQRLMWLFFRHGYGEEAYDFLLEYCRCFFTGPAGWKKRYRRVTALCRQTLLKHGEHQGSEALSDEKFVAELCVASRELKLYYGGADLIFEGDDPTRVHDAVDYLFEGPTRPPREICEKLATYAVNMRQGLRPRRGLVEIVR